MENTNESYSIQIPFCEKYQKVYKYIFCINNKIFETSGFTLENCRKKRDRWIKTIKI